MSVKDLFDQGKSLSTLKSGSSKDTFSDVESVRNVKELVKKQTQAIPPVNLSHPRHFAVYGSAKHYYQSAIKRVYNDYPYDGTAAEKNKFHNDSLYIEQHIFDKWYPRTTGHALFSADGWGSNVGALRSDGYGIPATPEYISFRGGPHTGTINLADLPNTFDESNYYDANIYDNEGLPHDYGKGTRISNLKLSGTEGVTVEFWLKKPEFNIAKTEREVVFDLWNNEVTGSGLNAYGRMRIEISGHGPATSGSSPFYVTLMSGGIGVKDLSVGANLTTASLETWRHYAVTMVNSGTFLKTKFYVDGDLNYETATADSSIGDITNKTMAGHLGGLLTAPSGSSGTWLTASGDAFGAGKLSASMDDFRFWKAARTSKEIGENYFTNIHGGTNVDIANTTLGIYYKFNEGITQTSSTDAVVLDYSGRISNGYWTGYTSNSRLTSSAIVESSASAVEFKDPIIRKYHPEVIALETNLIGTGSYHDINNNNMLYNTIPGWIRDEHDELGNTQIEYFCHIIGAYFDKLQHQIKALAEFNNTAYLSASYKPFPFSRNSLEGKGLRTPELFIDTNIIEKLGQRTDKFNYDEDLFDIKNLVFQNIHSNLVNIYKSKGTEKALRNILRSFGVGDDLIKVNLYASNVEFAINDNIRQQILKKKYVNFNSKYNTEGTVYQYSSSVNSDSVGFISGSNDNAYEDTLGFTMEGNVIFPHYSDEPSSTYFDRDFQTVSIFGMHSANTTDYNETTIPANDYANIQVQFIKDGVRSKDGYFKVTSSAPFPVDAITSSVYFDVYDNDAWQLSVTLRPKRHKEAGVVSGSIQSDGYDLIFAGYNTVAGITQNSFYLTSSIDITKAQNFLRTAKRIYVGSRKTNITGSTLEKSDIKASEIRYWAYSLDDTEIERHSIDIENVGVDNPLYAIGNLDDNFNDTEIRKINTLALHWNFNNVTSSDTSGQFLVDDVSSGSATTRGRFDWYGRLVGHQHIGKGINFVTSSENIISNQFINNAKYRQFEQIVSSDMVNILDDDDTTFGLQEPRPSNFHYAVEKSMYDVISQEMLNIFAGISDFNNIIGAPVHRYRKEYKDLEKLRQIFFERVGNAPDLDKYLEFYRWFDDAMALVIQQIVPATADIADDVYNVIESHVLERNKYETKYPTMEFKVDDPEASLRGLIEAEYDWEHGHAPLPTGSSDADREECVNVKWWGERSETDSTFENGGRTSGDSTIDTQRKNIRDIVYSAPHASSSKRSRMLATIDGTTYQGHQHALRSFSQVWALRVTGPVDWTIKGGVNFHPNKKMEYIYNATRPHGPLERLCPDRTAALGQCRVPTNVLIATTEESEKIKCNQDDAGDVHQRPNRKVKRDLKVLHGRDYDDIYWDYNTGKNALFFPLNVMSGGVNSGYNAQVIAGMGESSSVTNIHNDVYGPDMERPIQGPFTDHAVGGHQSRHIKLNLPDPDDQTLDHNQNRPEAWRLVFGRCETRAGISGSSDPGRKGAIGYIGADYPITGQITIRNGLQLEDFYPYTIFPRAVYYRDETAKRSINIRNIEHMTGTSGSNGHTVLGNYNDNWNVVQAPGMIVQRRYLRDASGSVLPGRFTTELPCTTNPHTLVAARAAPVNLQGNSFIPDPSAADYNKQQSVRYAESVADEKLRTTRTLQNRGKNDTVIISRFSHNGGPEVSSLGFLDVHAQEFSPYNAIPWRNLGVRGTSVRGTSSAVDGKSSAKGQGHGEYRSMRVVNHLGPDHNAASSADPLNSPQVGTASTSNIVVPNAGAGGYDLATRDGLNAMLTRHAGRFYSDGQYGEIYADRYLYAPAFHRTHRNSKKKLVLATDSTTTVDVDNITSASTHDNFWVSHPIPRSDRQYSWISASLISENDWFGYLPKDGLIQVPVIETLTVRFSAPKKALKAFRTGDVSNITQQNQLVQNVKPVTGPWVNNRTSQTDVVIGDADLDGVLVTISDGRKTVRFEFGDSTGYTHYGIIASASNGPELLTPRPLPTHVSMSSLIWGTGLAVSLASSVASRTVAASLSASIMTTIDSPNSDQTRREGLVIVNIGGSVANAAKNLVMAMTASGLNVSAAASPSSAGTLTIKNLNRAIADINPYEYVSSSEYGSIEHTNNNRYWALPTHATGAQVFTFNNIGQIAVQNGSFTRMDFVGLNHNIVEPISSSLNHAGYPFYRIVSTNTLEEMTSSISNSDGGFLGHLSYINQNYVNGESADREEAIIDWGVATMLNGLILNRQGPYGWPTWKQIRGGTTALMRYQRRHNTLRSEVGGTSSAYNVQPVVSKFKPVETITIFKPKGNQNLDIDATHMNEKWFFHRQIKNDEFGVHPKRINSPWQAYASVLKAQSDEIMPAAVTYSEVIFPAGQNMYRTSSRGRPGLSPHTQPGTSRQFGPAGHGVQYGYKQSFWRHKHSDRVLAGNKLSNSLGQVARTPAIGVSDPTGDTPTNLRGYYGTSRTHITGAGAMITQSCWPLDAALDFETKISGTTFGTSGAIENSVHIQYADPISSVTAIAGFITASIVNGEGELQNRYTQCHMGASSIKDGGTNGYSLPVWCSINPTALYSRKQTLPGAWSTSTRSGMIIPETASALYESFAEYLSGFFGEVNNRINSPGYFSNHRSYFWGDLRPHGEIDLFGGEAKWEANTQAGILVTTKSGDDPKNLARSVYFQTMSSNPWYEDYEDYIGDLRAVAKDFSVVPEFRISDHMEDLGNYDQHNFLKIDLGTASIDEDNCVGNFYSIFSNSDFLKGLHGVKNDVAGMANLDRLTLRCQAAMKFLPYKGFYPAQRTLDMVSQFSKSFGSIISVTSSHLTFGFHMIPSRSFDIGGSNHSYLPGSGYAATSGSFPQTWNNGNLSSSGERNQGAAAAHNLDYIYSSSLQPNNVALARPLMQTLFSPGILYNSIKAGMAVDYPVMYMDYSTQRGGSFLVDGNAQGSQQSYTGSANVDAEITQRFAFYPLVLMSGSASGSSSGSSEMGAANGHIYDHLYWNLILKAADAPYADPSIGWPGKNPVATPYWMISASHFDERIPFEAIIHPDYYAGSRPFADLEPHPSASILSCSAQINGRGDVLYSKMASNFFAGVADFYLSDGEYTNIKSTPREFVTVRSGTVYGMRIKLHRSMNKERNYQYDSFDNIFQFDKNGARHHQFDHQNAGKDVINSSGSYPIPQDPRHSSLIGLHETFTMYSRPSAFGPPCSGRYLDVHPSASVRNFNGNNPSNIGAVLLSSHYAYISGTMDSIDGYYWAHTPPYTNGEAWCDVIFKPKIAQKTRYTIQEVIEESDVYYWRADEGETGSLTVIPDAGGVNANSAATSSVLIPGPYGVDQLYSGHNINTNAMQLSGCFNLFGVTEEPNFERDGQTGNLVRSNTAAKQSWVIQTKFETPHLNFSDRTPRPISNTYGTLTLPLKCSESVPRGMWHQFGLLPHDEKTGIFLQVQDIPRRWLKHHRKVINEASVYNSHLAKASRPNLHRRYRSLADLVGFRNEPERLGEVRRRKVVSEAIVAIPFINVKGYKRFFSLNPKIFTDSVITDWKDDIVNPVLSRDAINLLRKMDKFILPPQFDFLTNPDDAARVVMYMFEFKWKFDQDDLSYMWQNLMPRHGKSYKISEEATISHELFDDSQAEFLSLQDFSDPAAPIQWMVFKVKQRGVANYYDKVTKKDPFTRQIPDLKNPQRDKMLKRYSYNWPYDYLSLIEMVKITADIDFVPGAKAHPDQITPGDIRAKKQAEAMAQTAQQAKNARDKYIEKEADEPKTWTGALQRDTSSPSMKQAKVTESTPVVDLLDKKFK